MAGLRSTLILLCLLITACSAPPQKPSLRDIDTTGSLEKKSPVFIKPKTEAEVRKAYADYLEHATQDDNSRLAAINRLAELEFELSSKLLEEQKNIESGDPEGIDEKLYNARLNKTIQLLSTSLRDYPKAKNNDKILYQIAKAYDQKGDYKKMIKHLRRLTEKYPNSPYYIEAQFRLAEEAFSRGDYISAEDAYTEVISSPKSDIFYEKSLFKRGWSRYKQQLYLESVDDYLEALLYHEFGDYDKLGKSEKEQFEEYFRAIGLAFSYLGGAEQLHEYFKNDPDFKYAYHAYSTVSDIYLKQERYSDAVATLDQFIKHNPGSENLPNAYLKTIEIWQKSGFTNKLHSAIEDLYLSFNPRANYWRIEEDPGKRKNVLDSLRKYVLLSAEYYHYNYQKKRKSLDLKGAELWYRRFIESFPAYVRKDNIYYLYAELLTDAKKYTEALKYYERAAFDGDLILHKEAAYASAVLTNKLYNQTKKEDQKNVWLRKHIRYSLLFSALYPSDKRSNTTILHASELAFASKQYQKTIELADLVTGSADNKTAYNANMLKAQSYFKLNKFGEAEAIYTDLLQSKSLGKKQQRKLQDSLAVSIYRQAENAISNNDAAAAGQHYARISSVTPKSEIAATGLYDAIALSMKNNNWDKAIYDIKRFQSLYPKNKLSKDVTKKLSVAYLKSGRDIQAAGEFEKISAFEKDKELKMAALWQAAELYEAQEDRASAIRSYRDYAKSFKRPFPQNMEAMYRLTGLYKAAGETQNADYWRNQILNTDKRASKKLKTDRTKFIASLAIIDLAKNKHLEFSKHRLVEPLKTNLRKKKKAMQDAVKLYGQASVYGVSEITTEATYSIASIYNDFSQALLDSERPKNLNAEEREQYDILLEDQAFPFEEKAIEFFETNLARVKDGTYNEWIQKSHAELKSLFPVRYKREEKIDVYIPALH